MCGRSFVNRHHRKKEKRIRTSSVFEAYITEWYSARQLSTQIHKEEYIVRHDIQRRLDANRIYCIDEVFSDVHYLMIDGYHLPWWSVLLVYYEYKIDKVIWFSIRDKEKKMYIVEDLQFLRDKMGYREIKSCSTDGSPGIISALKEVYPEVILQRCLVHIQRQVKSYITRHPKSQAWKRLKHITNYPVLSDPFLSPIALKVWKTTYQSYLNEKSTTRKGWWIYTHPNLRKAWKHITNALPYMYQSVVYNDPNIERTTNRLEGYFWVLTNEWINEHKWLSSMRLRSFLVLWIYLRNNR